MCVSSYHQLIILLYLDVETDRIRIGCIPLDQPNLGVVVASEVVRDLKDDTCKKVTPDVSLERLPF